MENFYLFLDIDGVLIDHEQIKRNYYAGIRPTTHTFNPKSIKALNYLVEFLTKEYDVHLVISSTWRIDMEETLKCLKRNKVKLEKFKSIDKTGHFYDENKQNHRDEEIKQFLREKGEEKNYLTIDDEAAFFNIPESKKVVTNIYNGALDLKMVVDWIAKNKIIDSEKD